jgi:hypothetical protein
MEQKPKGGWKGKEKELKKLAVKFPIRHNTEVSRGVT